MDKKEYEIEKDFTSLNIWQRSNQLALEIYTLCQQIPKEEKYRICDQTIRSSRSVSANIAEGYGRYYYKENISFCQKARGSLDETRSHLIHILDLGLVLKSELKRLIGECLEIRKMLNAYIKYLDTKRPD